MSLKAIWLGVAGILLGFTIGFLTASSINRSEINQLRSELETARSAASNSATATTSGSDLSDEEIRDKIAEADRDPTNLSFQKNLGLALYRYGALKSDTKIITEAIRLLERALKLSPSDDDTIVGLGNAWFDIGYANKDNNSFGKAKTYYEVALSKGPDDAAVRTDLAMTYFLRDPPDDQKATEEFKKALASDPKNQKALEFVVQALARLGDKTSARKYLDKLREAYPSDESVSSLASQIDQQSDSAPK